METINALYLDLLKRNLTNSILFEKGIGDDLIDPQLRGFKTKVIWERAKKIVKQLVVNPRPISQQVTDRQVGRSWPQSAETMIGLKRLDNIQTCIEQVVKEDIPGDLIETGVWRGGATIFMRAVLKSLGVTNRTVWVADSFEGLPKPEKMHVADKKDINYAFGFLAIDLEQVKSNFKRYHMLDEQVKFLKGWFKDTLPEAPINKLSLLRLDGDMYGSTMVALEHLYPKLSKGGYIIIDDYGAVQGCKKAVEDYRKNNGIYEDIIQIDDYSVYWKKNELNSSNPSAP